MRPDRYPERALKQRNKIINRVSENKKFQFSEWEKTTKIFTAKRDYNLYVPHLTDKLVLNNKQSLSVLESYNAFMSIMSGDCVDGDISNFLIGLKNKG